jgi:hypothetical protein
LQDDKQPDVITVDDIDASPNSVAVTDNDVPVNAEVFRDKWLREQDKVFELKDQLTELKAKLSEAQSNANTKAVLDKLVKPTADKAFWYMFGYSGFVGFLLLLNGFGCFVIPLDPEVMKFLVGSTAVTVIGLVGMVLTGVFVGARK